MRRREFISLLGGALAAQATPANAQDLRVRTVGVLMGFANDAEAKARTEAFEKGLESEGWSLGQNLRVEYRYAEPVTDALMRATRVIPIVFVAVSDPIGSGFVASMARPGVNITGFTVLQASVAGKYLEMLKEMVPQLARAAIMYNPSSVPAGGKFFFPVRSSSPRQS
jgi:putative ABC transport system substrate-binding protein